MPSTVLVGVFLVLLVVLLVLVLVGPAIPALVVGASSILCRLWLLSGLLLLLDTLLLAGTLLLLLLHFLLPASSLLLLRHFLLPSSLLLLLRRDFLLLPSPLLLLLLDILLLPVLLLLLLPDILLLPNISLLLLLDILLIPRSLLLLLLDVLLLSGLQLLLLLPIVLLLLSVILLLLFLLLVARFRGTATLLTNLPARRFARLVAIVARLDRALLIQLAGIVAAGVIPLIGRQWRSPGHGSAVPTIPSAALTFPVATPVLAPAWGGVGTPAAKIRGWPAVVAHGNAQHEQRYIGGWDPVPWTVVPGAGIPVVITVNPVQTIVEEVVLIHSRVVIDRITRNADHRRVRRHGESEADPAVSDADAELALGQGLGRDCRIQKHHYGKQQVTHGLTSKLMNRCRRHFMTLATCALLPLRRRHAQPSQLVATVVGFLMINVVARRRRDRAKTGKELTRSESNGTYLPAIPPRVVIPARRLSPAEGPVEEGIH